MWIPEETRFCSKYNQVGGKETLGLIHHLHPNNVDLNFCTAYFQLAIDTSHENMKLHVFHSVWIKNKYIQDMKNI